MAFRYSGFPPQTTEMAALCQRFRIPASNASVYTNAKTKYFHRPGNAWFLLVEALPQSPENTDLCSGNAARNAAATRFCKSLNLTVTNR